MARAARVAQLGEGLGLDLADPLTGEVELLPHLVEGERTLGVEAEAKGEDLLLAVVEAREQPAGRSSRSSAAAAASKGTSALSSASRSPSSVSSSPIPVDSDTRSRLTERAASTLCRAMPVSAASSSLVGSRPSVLSIWPEARVSAVMVSTRWDGRRMVRPLSAMPRPMAWRIHQVA